MKIKFKQNQGNTIVAALVLLTALAGSVLFWQQTQKTSVNKPEESVNSIETVQGAAGVPDLTFSREPEEGQDEYFDLVLKVNPNGAAFHAFELYVKFDPKQVTFPNRINLGSNIISSYPLIISSVDFSGNTVSVVGTKLSDPFTGSEDIELARVKMKKTGSVAVLNFSWGEDTKLGDKIAVNTVPGEF